MKPPLPLAISLLALGPVAAQTTLTNDGASLTVTSGATLYVAGSVQSAASSTLTNAGTVRLTGDLVNAGTLTSTGELLFNGAQDQTFTPGTATTVSTLTLLNTNTQGTNRLFLAGDLAVGSLLTLTQGVVRTQGLGASTPLYTLSLPASGRVQGEGPGQYVQGRLQVVRAVNPSTGSVDFTNGLVLNPNGQDLGTVTVTRTAGLQTAGVSYGQNVGGTRQGIDRVWQVVASGKQPSASQPASVTLSWVSNDDHGFNPATPVQLWRADQATGPWVPQGTPGSASARSFTANITQLGTLTVSNTSQPLPVSLVAFTAEAQGADALLRWATASELHNDRFEVEVSTDGQTFRRIGTVAGAGTSSQAHTYQLVDPAIAHYAASPVYYRLRQVDTDATFSYSPVRAVAVPRPAGLALFPNPATQAATLTGAVPGAAVTVFDALGRQLVCVPADGAGTATLVLPAGLAAGVYVVHTGQQALRLTVTN